MKPISFEKFVENYPGVVELNFNGFSVLSVSPEWIIDGETRLSYTTIVRLIEFCREYHWNKDIKPFFSTTGIIDSTTKEFVCSFNQPVSLNSAVKIEYRFIEIRNRAYSLNFAVSDLSRQKLYVTVSMVCVFIDLVSLQPVLIPECIKNYLLQQLVSNEVHHDG
jgi:acyl-CoA thioesterase FadM